MKWSCAFKQTRKSRTYKLEVLREHKPPPIRRIRISDFGLPDPKRDLDRHQNCITWSLSNALPLQKISSKSVHKFASNPTDRQTNRQTDRTKNITSFFGGGKNRLRGEGAYTLLSPSLWLGLCQKCRQLFHFTHGI